MRSDRRPLDPPLRLGVLISGRGSNMQAIARACREKRINAEVVVVIADREDAGGLAIARELGLKTAVVAWKQFADRAAFERALAQVLDEHRVEIVVLAGFMRILSPQFAEAYAGRLINIHPALLPKYRGLNTHRRCLDAGDTEHGASVHFATAELDGGPVILQSRLDVRPAETEQDLAARVLATEHVILPRVLGWLADGRLVWREGRGWLDGKPLDAPVVERFH
ncbi:MAG TPA: phosphoribosylglycinamide formyltransferase [Steroidobacteraceae bacterium]|nr:phosphoribosylglycinamide formyltransferase [Steroidobacteraceae bacterium]